jgi:hypothetical protein
MGFHVKTHSILSFKEIKKSDSGLLVGSHMGENLKTRFHPK